MGGKRKSVRPRQQSIKKRAGLLTLPSPPATSTSWAKGLLRTLGIAEVFELIVQLRLKLTGTSIHSFGQSLILECIY